VSKVVLDASALLALINNEKGAEKVEPLIGNIIMSSVNVSEVAGKIYDLLGSNTEEQCKLSIEPFIHSIIDFDQDLCYSAAALKSYTQHKGLSLGDRACIATGLYLGLPVYTADKIWGELNIKTLQLELIR